VRAPLSRRAEPPRSAGRSASVKTPAATLSTAWKLRAARSLCMRAGEDKVRRAVREVSEGRATAAAFDEWRSTPRAERQGHLGARGPKLPSESNARQRRKCA
jgi:hypothetical protein